MNKASEGMFRKHTSTLWMSWVMWPRHSVCVPWPWGLKVMSLKFTEPPSATAPTNLLRARIIFGSSTYQAEGLALPLPASTKLRSIAWLRSA